MNGFKVLHNAAEESAEVMILDTIGPSWLGLVGAKAFIRELRDLGNVKNLTVRMNSPGGDVFEGTAIYNALKEHPAKVKMLVDGLAASIASVIVMAGDEIVMAENAFLMIHNPTAVSWGEAGDLRKTAELLDQVKEQLVGVYTARTGQTAKDVGKWMDAETWFSAADAKAKGFATEVSANKAVAASWKAELHAWKHPPQELVAASPLPGKAGRGDTRGSGAPAAEPVAWRRKLAARAQRLVELA